MFGFEVFELMLELLDVLFFALTEGSLRGSILRASPLEPGKVSMHMRSGSRLPMGCSLRCAYWIRSLCPGQS